MCHLISNLKSIFSNFTQGFGSFAKVVVTAFLLGSLSVSSFATTTVGESSDFNAMSMGKFAGWAIVVSFTITYISL